MAFFCILHTYRSGDAYNFFAIQYWLWTHNVCCGLTIWFEIKPIQDDQWFLGEYLLFFLDCKKFGCEKLYEFAVKIKNGSLNVRMMKIIKWNQCVLPRFVFNMLGITRWMGNANYVKGRYPNKCDLREDDSDLNIKKVPLKILPKECGVHFLYQSIDNNLKFYLICFWLDGIGSAAAIFITNPFLKDF